MGGRSRFFLVTPRNDNFPQCFVHAEGCCVNSDGYSRLIEIYWGIMLFIA